MAWLKDVFTRLPYHRNGEAFKQAAAGDEVTSLELADLLPDQWLKAHPDQVWKIDEIRHQERQSKDKARKLKNRK